MVHFQHRLVSLADDGHQGMAVLGSQEVRVLHKKSLQRKTRFMETITRYGLHNFERAAGRVVTMVWLVSGVREDLDAQGADSRKSRDSHRYWGCPFSTQLPRWSADAEGGSAPLSRPSLPTLQHR